MSPLISVAIIALVLPIAGVTGAALAFGEVNTGAHSEYVEIYEDSSVWQFAFETFEDAMVIKVQNVTGFNSEGLSAYVQTVESLDDGEISHNLIIEIPQPGEEQNDAVIVYNVGAALQ